MRCHGLLLFFFFFFFRPLYVAREEYIYRERMGWWFHRVGVLPRSYWWPLITRNACRITLKMCWKVDRKVRASGFPLQVSPERCWFGDSNVDKWIATKMRPNWALGQKGVRKWAPIASISKRCWFGGSNWVKWVNGLNQNDVQLGTNNLFRNGSNGIRRSESKNSNNNINRGWQ